MWTVGLVIQLDGFLVTLFASHSLWCYMINDLAMDITITMAQKGHYCPDKP